MDTRGSGVPHRCRDRGHEATGHLGIAAREDRDRVAHPVEFDGQRVDDTLRATVGDRWHPLEGWCHEADAQRGAHRQLTLVRMPIR